MKDEEYEVTPRVEAVIDEEGNVITEAVEAVIETRSVPHYQGIDQSKIVPLLVSNPRATSNNRRFKIKN
jgi:hypothetical protein